MLGYRAPQIGGISSLVEIWPDLGFWREAFPYRRDRSGIDVDAAREVFVRLCFEAGLYEPPEELRPRGRGRPRKS